MTSKNIYILCPPNKATGGPEALHQLGYLLKEKGCQVKMLYSKRKINPYKNLINYFDNKPLQVLQSRIEVRNYGGQPNLFIGPILKP